TEPKCSLGHLRQGELLFITGTAKAGHPCGSAPEPEIDNRSSEQSQDLAEDQTADDRDPERFPEFGTNAAAKREGNSAEQRGHGGHHNGAETQQTGLVNGFFGSLAFFPLRFEGEIDHHNGVFLHDTYQKNDADQCNDVEVLVEQNESSDGTDAGGGQRGKNRHGVDVAFVQDAQDDVNRNDRGENQHGFVRQRIFKSTRGALEAGFDAGGHAEVGSDLADIGDRHAERSSGSEVERKGHDGKLALMVNCDRGRNAAESCEGTER